MSLFLVLEIFLNIFDTVFNLSIMTRQLGKKDDSKTLLMVMYGLFIVIITVLYNQFTHNSTSIIFIVIPLLVLFAYLFLKGNWLLKVFWISFPLILMMGIDFLAIWLLSIFYPQLYFSDFTAINSYRYQAVAVVLIIKVLFLGIMLRFRLAPLEYNRSAFITITSIATIGLLGLTSGSLLGFLDLKVSHNDFIKLIVVFFLINLIYLVVLLYLHRNYEERIKNQQKKMMVRTYEEVGVTIDTFQSYQGQVNDCLTSLWSYSKRNKLPEIETYINRLYLIKNQFDRLYNTGDPHIDKVLTGKSALAHKYEILLITIVELPESGVYYDSAVAAVIVMNLLDNAIRAINEDDIADDYRQIELVIQEKHSQLAICCKNITARKGRNKQEIAKLTDPWQPGLGLKIVKDSVEKLQGRMSIEHENYYFSINIELPLTVERNQKNA